MIYIQSSTKETALTAAANESANKDFILKYHTKTQPIGVNREY